MKILTLNGEIVCRECCRPLTDPASRAAGIGPHCAAAHDTVVRNVNGVIAPHFSVDRDETLAGVAARRSANDTLRALMARGA